MLAGAGTRGLYSVEVTPARAEAGEASQGEPTRGPSSAQTAVNSASEPPEPSRAVLSEPGAGRGLVAVRRGPRGRAGRGLHRASGAGAVWGVGQGGQGWASTAEQGSRPAGRQGASQGLGQGVAPRQGVAGRGGLLLGPSS